MGRSILVRSMWSSPGPRVTANSEIQQKRRKRPLSIWRQRRRRGENREKKKKGLEIPPLGLSDCRTFLHLIGSRRAKITQQTRLLLAAQQQLTKVERDHPGRGTSCVHLQLQGRLAESQTRSTRLVFWVSAPSPVAGQKRRDELEV